MPEIIAIANELQMQKSRMAAFGQAKPKAR
jgi:hypothetical protein